MKNFGHQFSKRTSDSSLKISSDFNEARQIQKVALYAFLINMGLVILKSILAIISGSLAVTAGAIDSATDSVASLGVYFGVRLSERKTKTFPLGLYKIENLISVVIALFIFFAGYEIITRIVQSSPRVPEISLVILIFLGLATGVTYLFGKYALIQGKKTGSPTLMAEGRHRQVDVLSSGIVFISVALNYFGIKFAFWGITIDKIAAGVVIIFIAKAGWELLSEGMRVLLDASIDHQTLEKIRTIILEDPMVTEIKTLVARNAGRFVFIQADLVMRTSDLDKAHKIGIDIENRIKEKIPRVGRMIIHYEPFEGGYRHIGVPVENVQGQISSKFGESPYFALVHINSDDNSIQEQSIQENPYQDMSKGRGLKVAEWLLNQKVDCVLVKEDISQKGPGYIFDGAGVKIEIIQEDNVFEAVQDFLQQSKKLDS